jgi:membrane associated rhomboid family serine protease
MTMNEVQGSGRRPLTPIVKGTLILLGVAFLVIAILARATAFGEEIVRLLVLDTSRVLARPWTLVSYALVHDLKSPLNLIFNAIVLYFFGPDLESRLGKERFVAFLLSAIVGGALLACAIAAISGSPDIVIGSTAACEALVVIWALLNRDSQVFLYFFPVKGITLLYFTIGFAVLNAVTGSAVSAAAQFGGILSGFAWSAFYVGAFRQRLLKRRLAKLEAERDAVVAAARRKSAAASGLRVIPGGKDGEGKNWLN